METLERVEEEPEEVRLDGTRSRKTLGIEGVIGKGNLMGEEIEEVN